MNFSKALEAIKQGKKVKRQNWGGYWRIETFRIRPHVDPKHSVFGKMIFAKTIDGRFVPAQPYQEDLLAEDWQIIE